MTFWIVGALRRVFEDFKSGVCITSVPTGCFTTLDTILAKSQALCKHELDTWKFSKCLIL